MSKLFLVPIDLNKLELLQPRAQQLASDPGSPVSGQFYYHTGNNALRFYNGSAWIQLGRLDQVTAPSASVAMNTQKLTGLAAGTTAGDSVRYEQAVLITGVNAFTANQPMGGFKLTGLAAGTTAGDSVRYEQAVLVTGVNAFTADQSLGGFKLTNVGTPTNGTDAANKDYVDGVASGLDVKASVRIATTGAETYTISGGAVTQIAGTSVDGVTGAVGNRILIKDAPASSGAGSAGSTQPGNGIYVVTNATTNLTVSRATDADTSAEVTAGMFTFVAEGTTNQDTGWILSTNDSITLNTTALTFVQFSQAGTITAGAGLTKTGSTIDVVAADGSITVNADSITVGLVPVSKGGTNATTAASARTNLAVPGQYAASFGDGAATSFNIDHNLGNLDCVVEVYRNSDGVKVETDVTHSTTNRVIIAVASAPSSNQYRAVVHANQ